MEEPHFTGHSRSVRARPAPKPGLSHGLALGPLCPHPRARPREAGRTCSPRQMIHRLGSLTVRLGRGAALPGDGREMPGPLRPQPGSALSAELRRAPRAQPAKNTRLPGKPGAQAARNPCRENYRKMERIGCLGI